MSSGRWDRYAVIQYTEITFTFIFAIIIILKPLEIVTFVYIASLSYKMTVGKILILSYFGFVHTHYGKKHMSLCLK